MENLTKAQQLSFFTVMQVLNEAGCIANRYVTISAGLSAQYSIYQLTGEFCLIITVKHEVVYVFDVDVEKAIYFVNRANGLSLI